jgi:hypothetical protein
MTFWSGLLAGRSHVAVLVGIGLAFAIAQQAARWTADASSDTPRGPGPHVPRGALPLRPRGALAERERVWVAAAWSYFARETEPVTGLAHSVEGYPSTTLWDEGSHLLAVLSAEELGLVSRDAAQGALRRAVHSLAQLPLCEGRLPNKAYHTATLAMVDYDNAPAPAGIGWSALDVARAVLALTAVAWRHPALAGDVRAALDRWDLDALRTPVGQLQGTTRGQDGVLRTYQEGRLGYEQYAARALLLAGVPAGAALDYRAHLAVRDVGGQEVPVDARTPERHGHTLAPVLSEPWILAALELGLDGDAAPLARAVLLAQERRAARTGRLTAVSEDHLDRPPRFVYATVLNGDREWAVVAADGTEADGLRTLSAKAAAGWGTIFEGAYPDRLLDAVDALVTPRGILAGRYDRTGEPNAVLSVNTQAVVLEALAYRVHGPRLRGAPARRVGERAVPEGEAGDGPGHPPTSARRPPGR